MGHSRPSSHRVWRPLQLQVYAICLDFAVGHFGCSIAGRGDPHNFRRTRIAWISSWASSPIQSLDVETFPSSGAHDLPEFCRGTLSATRQGSSRCVQPSPPGTLALVPRVASRLRALVPHVARRLREVVPRVAFQSTTTEEPQLRARSRAFHRPSSSPPPFGRWGQPTSRPLAPCSRQPATWSQPLAAASRLRWP